MNPQSSSNSNSASMDGTDGGKEEEAEASDPRPCSSSNQASLDGTGVEEKKKQGRQNLHTYSSSNWVSMDCTKMGSPDPHMRGTWRRMKISVLSHQKSDATSICFEFWLKEEETPFLSYREKKISKKELQAK